MSTPLSPKLIAALVLGAASLAAQTDLLTIDSQHEIPLDAPPVFVLFQASSHLMALATNHSLRILDGGSGVVRSSQNPCGHVGLTAGAAAQDGASLAVGCGDGSIAYLHWDGATSSRSSSTRGKKIVALAFSPNGSYLLSTAEDRALRLWSTADGSEVRVFGADSKKQYVFGGFTLNALSVVGVTSEGRLFEWDAKTGRTLRELTLEENSVFCAASNSAGTLLAVAGEYANLNKGSWRGSINPADFYRSDRLLIFNAKQGIVVKQIDGIDGQIRSLSFSSDNRFIAIVRQRTKTSFLSIFDIQRGVEILARPVQLRSSLSTFSLSGDNLAAVSPAGSLNLLQVSGLQLSTESGDLAGQRIRPTSDSKSPLIVPAAADTLAIMDLDALGVERNLGRTVSEMLRNQIVGAGVKVVAGDRMKEIIQAQNFSLSDRTDAGTAIALGKILNANKMVFGSVSALGATYSVNVQLVDVQTAEVRGVREVLCQRCTVEDLPNVVLELKSLLIGNRVNP